MRKVCVSQDRESTLFSVIYSLRFYPYTRPLGLPEEKQLGFLLLPG